MKVQNFPILYDKALEWCKDSPEIPQFVYDVLNHYEVRSHCFEVCRAIMEQPLPLQDVKELVAKLSDDDRMDLFGGYCKHCGTDDPRCQCWNDE